MLIQMAGCANKYAGWKGVTLLGVGTFKVPQDWIVTQQDDVVYLTDKPLDSEDYKTYLVGEIGEIWSMSSNGTRDRFDDTYELFGNVQVKSGETISSVTLSNSAAYGQREFVVDGNGVTKYFIMLWSEKVSPTYLIVWDNLLDENTILKIAASFGMELT